MMKTPTVRQWTKAMGWLALPTVVVALAVTRPGYPVEAVDMTDSSVWVVNMENGQRKVARYNQPIEELTGGFAIDEVNGPFDVVQAGPNVAIPQATDFRVVDTMGMKLAQPTS
ncbi:MAG: hypothetical protein LBH68_02525, partial [Bifidobacteriaceae bacterium]|nr:hypothetical protein [Bifidobacteriaceae bacterium]